MVAVDHLELTIDYGEIFGLLGPNGAGKSTTLNMLCTILPPTSGTAIVNGYDVRREPAMVRQSIGIVFQDPSLDDRLTGRENLELHAVLYGIPRDEARKRIDNMLSIVDLADRANDYVSTYSGGMRRRLEIARGLLHYPKVLFLDEPTIGLDLQTREYIWDYIESLIKREKITVVLTTHYMEEADRLCSRIAIVDHGKIIALDTPEGLKRNVGGDVISVFTDKPQVLADGVEKARPGTKIKVSENARLDVCMREGSKFLPQLVRIADQFGISIDEITIHQPTLNDVFLHYTGREIREEKGVSSFRMAAARGRFTR